MNDTPTSQEGKSSSLPALLLLIAAVIVGGLFMAFTKTPKKDLAKTPVPTVAGTQNTDTLETPTPEGINIKAVDPARDHILGDINAPVTLVVFSDTECPYCKRFHIASKQIVSKYEGKVRLVYRHNPLDGLHNKARKEAEATECANEQGKFWAFIDKLYEITPSNDGLDEAQLPVIAKDTGLDVDSFNSCLSSGKFANRVQEDSADAPQKATPYTVIIPPNGIAYRVSPDPNAISAEIEKYVK